MMLIDTALKLDVFEALDQAVENGYWAEAEDFILIAYDLACCAQQFETFTVSELLPHVADWKRLHGPR